MESRCKTTALATWVWIHHVTCFFYTTWPKVCRQTLHPCVIVKYFVPKPWGLLWRNNSLHPSGKARHMIVEPGCRVLLPFSLKSFREVFQFIPKVLDGGRGQASGQASLALPRQTRSLWTWLCARGNSVTLTQERVFLKLRPQSWKCNIV